MRCTDCPVEVGPCLGERAARLCELAASRPEYRRLLVDRARGLAGSAGGRGPTLDDMLARVARCSDRGAVLAHALQPECGCGELTECRAGRGARPGRVSLRECLGCVSAPESLSA